jgi:hypothetical protein
MALVLQSWEKEDFLSGFGHSLGEIELKKVTKLMIDERYGDGKYEWANFIMNGKNDETYDLYGTPNEKAFDHLKPAFTFQSLVLCNSCNQTTCQPFTYILLDVTSDLKSNLKGFLTNERVLSNCSNCNSFDVQHSGTTLTSGLE